MSAATPASSAAPTSTGDAAALPEWLAGRSLLITGGLGSLGVLFGLWAIQQVLSLDVQTNLVEMYNTEDSVVTRSMKLLYLLTPACG